MPAIFIIRRDQQLVAALSPASCRALLPHLLTSLDAHLQAVNVHYTAH